jgi:alpha-tubulin suppressor-like RCC1 family protein
MVQGNDHILILDHLGFVYGWGDNAYSQVYNQDKEVP